MVSLPSSLSVPVLVWLTLLGYTSICSFGHTRPGYAFRWARWHRGACTSSSSSTGHRPPPPLLATVLLYWPPCCLLLCLLATVFLLLYRPPCSSSSTGHRAVSPKPPLQAFKRVVLLNKI